MDKTEIYIDQAGTVYRRRNWADDRPIPNGTNAILAKVLDNLVDINVQLSSLINRIDMHWG